MMLEDVKREILDRENILGEYATKTREAIRLKSIEEDIRPAFFHDTDRIIHSNSYSRYNDKTQVFSYSENDNVSRRMVHVQLVSKVARTIGKCLNLNEDLLEAIALGHDIGHAPLGHTGEKILDEISRRDLNIPFMHNLQSVRTFMCLTNNGKGSNLTIQVLDGIMCHNGEILEGEYAPVKKTKDEFLKNYELSCLDKEYSVKVKPMTLEGCVVRVSDVIAYLGRDIEDAILLGKIKRDDIPVNISSVLGNSNKDIVNSIIIDIVKNSYGKNKIVLSKNVFAAMNELMKFNYEHIYNLANTKEALEFYKVCINSVYDYFLKDLESNNRESKIFKVFLNKMNNEYLSNNYSKIVIDFIAGMTDDYLLKTYNEIENKK